MQLLCFCLPVQQYMSKSKQYIILLWREHSAHICVQMWEKVKINDSFITFQYSADLQKYFQVQ